MSFNIAVEQIIPSNTPIVTIPSNETVPKALKTLASHKIYCAPVLEGNKVIGLLDLVDIVAFIVSIFNDDELLKIDFLSKFHMEQRWLTEHAAEILNLSQKNPLYIIKKDTSLKDAINALNEKGCRRLLVQNNEGKIESILTQSAIIEWLSKHLSSIGNAGKQTVKGLGTENLVYVYAHQPVIEAFKLMSKHRITSVAILDSNGKIFSNISAKDLKVVVNDQDMFTNLFKSAQQFISLSRQLEYETEFAAAIVIHETDTLELAIQKLAVSKIHRIYVVDSNFRPTRIISLTDILKLLNSH